ncbi:MAG TPA: hypothetical protein VHC22_00405 [Pirellulales bacterium]|nr:hypothetical protein [Pirellulales bacterium]
MPRQFTLKTLLWLMACLACYLAGIASHRAYVEYRWVNPNFDEPPIFRAPE